MNKNNNKTISIPHRKMVPSKHQTTCLDAVILKTRTAEQTTALMLPCKVVMDAKHLF
ncbi:hypothetical protein EXN66_Car015379 [Channa argus]|uniref:Uncharacterized protein n=1 Tax=Channa argus TaxID=215402 RepID=A0A6G1QAX6_CHAAH|nr:hypothetical protein EXN66_Car015379 [Channa argus]